jgi:hypothetical protein
MVTRELGGHFDVSSRSAGQRPLAQKLTQTPPGPAVTRDAWPSGYFGL